MQFHPDRNPDNPEAEERFKECSEAYAVLADSEKRTLYDRYGHAGVSSAAQNGSGFGGFDPVIFQDFGDILGDFFGFGDMFGGGSRRRSRAQRGADLRADLVLDFEQAVFGHTTSIDIQRHETCEACHGAGGAGGKGPVTCPTCGGRGQVVSSRQGFLNFSVARTCPACNGAGSFVAEPCPKCHGEQRILHKRTVEVNVPAGVEDGNRIRYNGQGEAGVNGGPSGDLYVVLQVRDHKVFEREGKDLYCSVPISITQAILGAKITIPTLEGEHTLKIPEGTQPGATFRIKGQGVPELNGRGKGDLYVEVKVQIPTRLNRKQTELLEQLHATLAMENKPERRHLIKKVKDIFS
jgi:molecular chaperone DnaJ